MHFVEAGANAGTSLRKEFYKPMASSTSSVTPLPGPAQSLAESSSRRWLTAETKLWRALLCGPGSGALWGTVLAAMLAGYEQQLLPMPWNLLLFGFLGFAFVSAGGCCFKTLCDKPCTQYNLSQ